MGLVLCHYLHHYPLPLPKHESFILMSDVHLVPLAPHIEDDGALADLVGDDEERGGRVDRPLRRVPVLVVHDLLRQSVKTVW